jgi:hypothetical protein
MTFHKDIEDRWPQMSIFDQMANIGAEVGRALKWKNKGNKEISLNAMYRALELIDLTIKDKKNKSKLSELCRMREVFLDHVIGENIYNSKDSDWDKYFYFFTVNRTKQ